MKELYGPKIEQLFKKRTSEQKIAEVFYKNPYIEFTLSEISQISGVSKSQSSSIIREIGKENFIVLKELGKKSWRIRANNESFDFRKRKIAYNINLIFSTNLIEYLGEKFGNPKSITLFGSFRLGEDGKESDIDIAVEIAQKKGLEIIELKELAPLEKFFGRKIRIHVFNRKMAEKNLFSNILNGIVLSGFLEAENDE